MNTDSDVTPLAWRKSSYSGGTGGNCVEELAWSAAGRHDSQRRGKRVVVRQVEGEDVATGSAEIQGHVRMLCPQLPQLVDLAGERFRFGKPVGEYPLRGDTGAAEATCPNLFTDTHLAAPSPGCQPLRFASGSVLPARTGDRLCFREVPGGTGCRGASPLRQPGSPWPGDWRHARACGGQTAATGIFCVVDHSHSVPLAAAG
ncbi:DUF397 domain-containing protein [Frankia sp. ACN1ag]|uniref:DUF397 domain-containing protein n=1 Tax=Frankia sp. ACN1ag TaxID=102891 RepID=UPI0037BFC6A0